MEWFEFSAYGRQWRIYAADVFEARRVALLRVLADVPAAWSKS